MTTARLLSCPECGAQSTNDSRFVEWCHSCGWHADPSPPPAPKGWIKRRAARRDDRAVREVFQVCATAKDLRALRVRSKAVAVVCAIVVHLATVVVLVLAVYVATTSLLPPIRVLLSAALVGTAVLVRPRFGKPPRGVLVPREEAPVLWGCVEELCQTIGARPPDFILVDGTFNAGYGSVGLRRRRYLRIGYPLWNILSPEERIGLLSHEMAHDVNHDLRRSVITYTALNSLSQWFRLFTPSTHPVRRRRQVSRSMARSSAMSQSISSLEMITPVLFAPIAAIVALAGNRLRRITERVGQHAEYVADDFAADVAGTESFKSLLVKLLVADACFRALQSASQQGLKDLWDAESEFVASVPASEIDRRRRVAGSRLQRVDVSHPPTELRIQLIESRRHRLTRVPTLAQRLYAVDQELSASSERIQISIRQRHPPTVRRSQGSPGVERPPEPSVTAG
jgi:Zn-dependent protease with chaperone function